jgi:hypothetical protein
MTGLILKILIFGFVGWFVYTGVRRLIRDFTKPFRNMAAPPPPPGEGPAGPRPDVSQQRGTNVIDLTRGDDGVYRPPGEDRR